MPRENSDDITQAVYCFLGQYIGQHGYAPNQREIAEACYISQPTALRYLDQLTAQGRIWRVPGKPRSIRLLNPPASNW